MITREELVQTAFERGIDAYDEFYFSQDSPGEIAKVWVQALLDSLALEAVPALAGDDAHAFPEIVVAAEFRGKKVQFCFHYEQEPRYYWEFVTAKKILKTITIASPPDAPAIITREGETRRLYLENPAGRTAEDYNTEQTGGICTP